MALITTILPTFRRPQLLKRAIESVLNQTLQDFNLYIFDNASGDETSEIVSKYRDPRIHYFCRPTNIGLFENFARGLDHVQTPYFSFLSDDDYLLPCFYETALEGFKHQPDAGFSAGCTVHVNAKDEPLPQQFKSPYLEGFFPAGIGIKALITTQRFPTWTGILFKTEVCKKIGGIDTRLGLAIDLEFTIRYASNAPFVICRKPVAAYTIWKQAASSTLAGSHITQFDLVIENVHQHFMGTPEEHQDILQHLSLMKLSGLKSIWFESILTNQVANAVKAKELYLQNGGSVDGWKLKILSLSEKSPLLRALLQLYFRLRYRKK